MNKIKYKLLSSCLILLAAISLSGCSHSLPEFNPSKEASSAPGKEWEPRKEEYSYFFPTEKLPGIPPELEPFSKNLTLSQLVDVALTNNPSTLQAWEQARAAAAAWAVARGIYYPQVNGVVKYGFSKGGDTAQGIDPFKEQYGQALVTLNYLLLDFGGRSAQSEAARLALINANWNHNQVIQDVLLSVAVSYYQYIGNKAQTRADEANLEEAQTSLEAAQLRLEAGVGTLPDVLQAQATVAQVELNLVSDRGAVETSRGELATAVGWLANTFFDVSEEPGVLPLEAIERNVEELITLAKQNRPELAAVQAFVRQQESELSEAESNRWPQLLGFGQISRWWVKPEGESGDFFTNYMVGLQLQVPIFQGFALLNSVREARANLKAAQAALLLEAQEVIEDVWNSYFEFRTAAGQLDASEAFLASALESYEASLARYRAGVGDIVELLNAQSLLAQARAQKVQATTSVFTSYAELVHSIGAEIPEPQNANSSKSNNKLEGTSSDKQ